MIRKLIKDKAIVMVSAMLSIVILIFACGPNELNDPKTSAPQATNGSKTIGHQQQPEVEAPKMSIVDAKTAWEEKLMSISGVTGVAIGLSSKGNEKVIKVYVSKTGHVATDQIPTQIEGFNVEIEPRGTFQIY